MTIFKVRNDRDERGAVAILVALFAVVIFIAGALAVDLGNAWQHKRERQKDTDLAALAGAGPGGANLPAAGTSGTCSYGNKAASSDQAVIDVAANLSAQLGVTITAAQLADCDVDGNGEVFYGKPRLTNSGWTNTFNKNQLSLVSPPDAVDFGFAGIMGIDGTTVNGIATVEIRSPKLSTLPFYSFDGCDYGPQTLQQPNNGHASSLALFAPTETNAATLTSVVPNYYPAGTPTGTPQPIDINGTNLAAVTDVGFFEAGNGGPGPAPVTATGTSTPFTINAAGTQIHFNDLPDATRGVTGVQTFWFIRVKIGGQWSKVNYGNQNNPVWTPMLTIGDPPLLCGQGSSQGNFGTLLLSHPPYNGWDKIGAANVADGLISDLGIYPQAGAPADGTCSTAQTVTILWSTSGTNCVDTDTGMSANVATGGFLGIGSSAPAGGGRLTKPFTTKCGPGDSPATTVVKGVTINNDTLTCFLTDNTTNLATVYNKNYAGPIKFSSEIYDSPRFGWVPVLRVQPANGGSKKYQIIDFRPTFVTDQPGSAVKGDAPSAANGIITDNNGIKSVQVIFLNMNALPPPPAAAGTSGYVGSGIKIPLLVD